MKVLNFYKTESGHCPVEVFLNSLTSQQAQKVIWVLQLLEEAPVPPAQYFNKLIEVEDIWEIKVPVKYHVINLLVFFETEQLIVLTHGFMGPSQKGQLQEEIKIADLRKQDYFNRKQAIL